MSSLLDGMLEEMGDGEGLVWRGLSACISFSRVCLASLSSKVSRSSTLARRFSSSVL